MKVENFHSKLKSHITKQLLTSISVDINQTIQICLLSIVSSDKMLMIRKQLTVLILGLVIN